MRPGYHWWKGLLAKNVRHPDTRDRALLKLDIRIPNTFFFGVNGERVWISEGSKPLTSYVRCWKVEQNSSLPDFTKKLVKDLEDTVDYSIDDTNRRERYRPISAKDAAKQKNQEYLLREATKEEYPEISDNLTLSRPSNMEEAKKGTNSVLLNKIVKSKLREEEGMKLYYENQQARQILISTLPVAVSRSACPTAADSCIHSALDVAALNSFGSENVTDSKVLQQFVFASLPSYDKPKDGNPNLMTASSTNSKAYRPNILRVVVSSDSADSPPFGFLFSNLVTSEECLSMNGSLTDAWTVSSTCRPPPKLPPEVYIKNNQVLFMVSVLKGSPLEEAAKIARKIMSFTSYYWQVNIKEICVDLLRGMDGDLYFTNVKGFRIREPPIPLSAIPAPVNGTLFARAHFEAMERLEGTILEPDEVESTPEMLHARNDFRLQQAVTACALSSLAASGMKLKCAMCGIHQHKTELTSTLTSRMILEVVHSFMKRGVEVLAKNTELLSKCMNHAFLHQTHRVCCTCFSLYRANAELSQLEIAISCAVGLPMNSFDTPGDVDESYFPFGGLIDTLRLPFTKTSTEFKRLRALQDGKDNDYSKRDLGSDSDFFNRIESFKDERQRMVKAFEGLGIKNKSPGHHHASSSDFLRSQSNTPNNGKPLLGESPEKNSSPIHFRSNPLAEESPGKKGAPPTPSANMFAVSARRLHNAQLKGDNANLLDERANSASSLSQRGYGGELVSLSCASGDPRLEGMVVNPVPPMLYQWRLMLYLHSLDNIVNAVREITFNCMVYLEYTLFGCTRRVPLNPACEEPLAIDSLQMHFLFSEESFLYDILKEEELKVRLIQELSPVLDNENEIPDEDEDESTIENETNIHTFNSNNTKPQQLTSPAAMQTMNLERRRPHSSYHNFNKNSNSSFNSTQFRPSSSKAIFSSPFSASSPTQLNSNKNRKIENPMVNPAILAASSSTGAHMLSSSGNLRPRIRVLGAGACALERLQGLAYAKQPTYLMLFSSKFGHSHLKITLGLQRDMQIPSQYIPARRLHEAYVPSRPYTSPLPLPSDWIGCLPMRRDDDDDDEEGSGSGGDDDSGATVEENELSNIKLPNNISKNDLNKIVKGNIDFEDDVYDEDVSDDDDDSEDAQPAIRRRAESILIDPKGITITDENVVVDDNLHDAVKETSETNLNSKNSILQSTSQMNSNKKDETRSKLTSALKKRCAETQRYRSGLWSGTLVVKQPMVSCDSLTSHLLSHIPDAPHSITQIGIHKRVSTLGGVILRKPPSLVTLNQSAPTKVVELSSAANFHASLLNSLNKEPYNRPATAVPTLLSKFQHQASNNTNLSPVERHKNNLSTEGVTAKPRPKSSLGAMMRSNTAPSMLIPGLSQENTLKSIQESSLMNDIVYQAAARPVITPSRSFLLGDTFDPPKPLKPNSSTVLSNIKSVTSKVHEYLAVRQNAAKLSESRLDATRKKVGTVVKIGNGEYQNN